MTLQNYDDYSYVVEGALKGADAVIIVAGDSEADAAQVVANADTGAFATLTIGLVTLPFLDDGKS